MNMSAHENQRLRLLETSLGIAQVMEVPKAVRRSRRTSTVFELWTPEENPDPAPLHAIATELAMGEGPTGFVIAEKSLGLHGGEVGRLARHRLWHFDGAKELMSLIKDGWNAAQLALQIFPDGNAPDLTSELDKAFVSDLWTRRGFVLTCAHDGEALQVIAMSGNSDRLRRRLFDAAVAAGVMLEQNDASSDY